MDKKHLNTADCIRRYSRARVITPSKKKFVTRWETRPDGTRLPVEFSRELTAADARESLVRKYR